MTQAFIVVRAPDGSLEQVAQPTPTAMTEVWFATPDSPLNAQARERSKNGATSLSVLQWEADVLKLWAFQDGELQFEYDSSPSFATCTITPPVASGTGDLAALFGRPASSAAVARLLSRKKGLGFISENQRLAQLLGLLGVNTPASSVA
jgi:hypothetical protein